MLTIFRLIHWTENKLKLCQVLLVDTYNTLLYYCVLHYVPAQQTVDRCCSIVAYYIEREYRVSLTNAVGKTLNKYDVYNANDCALIYQHNNTAVRTGSLRGTGITGSDKYRVKAVTTRVRMRVGTWNYRFRNSPPICNFFIIWYSSFNTTNQPQLKINGYTMWAICSVKQPPFLH